MLLLYHTNINSTTLTLLTFVNISKHRMNVSRRFENFLDNDVEQGVSLEGQFLFPSRDSTDDERWISNHDSDMHEEQTFDVIWNLQELPTTGKIRRRAC